MTGILLAVGETMAMVSPTAAVPVLDATEFHVDAGGAESNVAAHASALGIHSRWYSRLGDDPLGHRVAAQLRARGIDVSAVEFDPVHRTGLYVKDPGQGVHYYREDSAASHLSPFHADTVDLSEVGVLHVSGITAALTGTAPSFLSRLIDCAHLVGTAVSFDVNHRPTLWPAVVAAPVLESLVRRSDIVFVGRDEAERLWDTPTPSDIRARFPDTPELVVKDGDVGATVFIGDTETFVPALTVDVVEAVGAGDAFAGGYLAARMKGQEPADRLAAGHIRAALTLQTTGDSIQTARQIESRAR